MRAIKIYERILGVAMCVFLVVFPFLMGLHVEELSGMAEMYFAKRSGYQIDIFQHCKEIALIIFSVFLLILLVLGVVLSYIVEEKLPARYKMNRIVAALLLVFLLFNVVSSFFSEYSEYSLWGLFLDYEGLIAVAGYVILFAAGYFLLGTEAGMKMVLVSVRLLALMLIIGACVECVIGPVFNIQAVARALTPDRYEHLLENVYLDYNGSIALTFANPGYFGGICALIFPILYGTGLTGGRRIFCICDELLAGGLFFCIVMSGSSGALYAAALAVLAETLFVIYRKKRSGRYWGIPLCLLAAGAVSLLMGQSQIMEGDGMAGRIGASVVNPQYKEDENVFRVDRIRLDEGVLRVDSGEDVLEVRMGEDEGELSLEGFRFTDGNGNEIPVETDLIAGTHLTGNYKDVYVSVEDQILSLDLGYQDPVEFYCYDGALHYIDFNGSYLDEIPQPQMSVLSFMYPLFTGRGYIWASSIPLVGECIFLGKGIGSFPFYYPQSEVAGMLNVHGSADYCIEIAHSWYLQTAVNGGLVALACMLGLFGIHLFLGLRCCLKGQRRGIVSENGDVTGKTDMPGNAEDIGRGLFFGIIAFQITGIVNNSTVATGPVFWMLFGAGMGFLFHIRNCSNGSNGLRENRF